MEFADKPYVKKGDEADMIAKKQQSTLEAAKRQMRVKGTVIQPHQIETFGNRPKIETEEKIEVVPENPSPLVQQALKYTAPKADKKHPIIAQMMQSFGLKHTKRYELTLSKNGGSIKYTMTIVPDDVGIWAFKEASTKAVIDGDPVGTGWFQCLMACLSVVAIGDVPVWQAFGVTPIQDEIIDLQDDPLNISSRIRKLCSMQLSKLVWSEMGPIGDKIYEFYEAKIIQENKVNSSYEAEQLKDDKERYVCPLDECDVVEYLEPLYGKDGNELSFYCKRHQVELIKTLGQDGPLV